MIEKKDKVKLVYIASNGRSGSTLLDMLLGKNAECHTLGEFQMLPIDYQYNTQPCGCGSSVKECNFWQKIFETKSDVITSGEISRFRSFGFGKVLRWKELTEIYWGKSLELSAVETYGYENYSIMQEVKNNLDGNVEYLVDASKDPYRLKWLAQSGYFDIKVLHIIKQPQAFVYSMTKQENGFYKRLYLTIRMSIRWIIENSIIKSVSRKYVGEGNYRKVRYEDLATNPVQELNYIYDLLHITSDPFGEGDTFKHESHAISGNKMRFSTSSVYLDEAWKKKMNSTCSAISHIITLPFSKIYK